MINLSTFSCSISSLTLGTCLPGVYTLQYSVKGLTSGLNSLALLQVYVEIRTSYLLSFSFKPQGVDLTDQATVQNLTSGLSSNSTSSTQLALQMAPLFGINVSSMRHVSVNGTSVDALALSNSTLIYAIQINMTVITACLTPPLMLPAPIKEALDAQNASRAMPRRRGLSAIASRSRPLSLRLDAAISRYDLALDSSFHSLGLLFDSLDMLQRPEALGGSRRSLLASQPCLGASNLTVPNMTSSDLISASLPVFLCSSSFVSVESVTQAYLVGVLADTMASLMSLQATMQSMQDVVSLSISLFLCLC